MKNINKELAIQKGLIIEDNYDWYNNIEKVYKYLFESYLMRMVNLKEYNDKIKNSGLDFGVSHPTQAQLISGIPEYLNLEYIYLLNNFYVEKMDINYINVLKEYAVKGDFTLNDVVIDIVKRTYKDVIRNNYRDGSYTNDSYKICYGYAIPSNMCDNDALVLKIYYSKNTTTMNDIEFIKNIKDKEAYLKEVSNHLINEIKEKLDINVCILVEKIPN